jgi:hypothetical protein
MYVGLVPSVQTSRVGTGVNAHLALMVTHIPQAVQMLMNVHAVCVEGMHSAVTFLEASGVHALQDMLETHSMNVQVSWLPLFCLLMNLSP